MLLKHSDYILKILTFQSHLRYYLSNKLKSPQKLALSFQKGKFVSYYLLDCEDLSKM